jgi:hypothetical protein
VTAEVILAASDTRLEGFCRMSLAPLNKSTARRRGSRSLILQ